MTSKKTNIYTDGTYVNRHPEWHVPDSAWKAKHTLNILSKNNLVPKSICEVGCGAGEIIRILHDAFSNDAYCCGYEISPQAFELCKTREKEGLDYFLKDFLKEDNKFFDLLLCYDVFEHVDDYLGFIRSLKDKSRYKIFHVPLDISAQSVFREKHFERARREVGHIHYFTKFTAIETLKSCGYKIIDAFYTKSSLERDSPSLLNSLFARVPREVLFKINQDFAAKLMGGFSVMILVE